MTKTEMILSELNNEQREALLYFESPLRIIAGAGSGKTRVLTRKIAYLVNDLGVSSKEILAVTFTNKAANEMATRVKSYVGPEANDLTISTFHSFCAKVLRIEAIHLGLKNDFLIVDEKDRQAILAKINKKYDQNGDDVNYKNMMNLFSSAKIMNKTSDELVRSLNENNSYSPEANKKLGEIFDEYNQTLKDKSALDYDDLIIQTKILFDKFPDISTKWSKKFSFILVDEFQDTSELQYEIIKHLTKNGAHITIVGDPDQTIYSWRGADVNLILNFDKDFPNTKTVILNTNYRSTQTILNAANSLIRHNKKRFSKDLITARELGEEIMFTQAFSVEAEARWVVHQINELKRKKIQLKNIAIFYRSNYYSRPFEEELMNENINFKIFNGQKFLHRREVKDALAFLRVIYDFSDIPFLRIINIPKRNIGEVTIAKIEELAKKLNTSIYNALMKNFAKMDISRPTKLNIRDLFNCLNKYATALKNNKISTTLDSLLKEIGYYKYIENDVTLKETGLENVKELISSIEHWESKNSSLGVKDYLQTINLMSAEDEYDNGTNYVSLMNVHSSKGLEFDNVFLVGMSDQIFPSHRALGETQYDALEEERRLAYVAITRARDRLFISDSRGYQLGTNIRKTLSRFVEEMGIDTSRYILKEEALNFDYSDITDAEDIKKINKKIIRGDIISHTIFGEGEVLEVDDETIKVRFVNTNSERTLNKNHNAVRLLSDKD